MTAFDYLIVKLPTAATIAVVVAFLSTLLTRDSPFTLGGVLFFAGVWLAMTIIGAVVLMIIELIRDRL